MSNVQIVKDFNTLAIPMDMIAKKHGVSLHCVIKVIHYHNVTRLREIEESTRCLNQMK